MNLRRWLRLPTGLLPRIYLVGVAQLVLVAVTLAVARDFLRDQPWKTRFIEEVSYLSDEWARQAEDPAALQASLERARSRMGVQVTVRRVDGQLLANTQPIPAPPLPRSELEVVAGRPGRVSGPPGPFTALGPWPGSMQVYTSVSWPPPPPPDGHMPFFVGLVLVCTAITSVLFARTLAVPLLKLAAAARAFGAGRLDVRTGLRRQDELGEVSEAFDEMAGRITLLLRSQKELLANVSHELRTPLSRIHVALDLASEGDATLARESLADIAEDLSELERLVDDVLTTSRLELGAEGSMGATPPLRVQRVDPRVLVDKAAQRFRSSWSRHHLDVRVEEPLPSLVADPVLLRRVLDNLLDNAGKYSEPGTQVRLTAKPEGEGLRVEVSDEGIGIDSGDLPRIGTPFFRTDRSRARTTGGVGMGLTLVRRIVDAHGGTLTLESRPGQGTLARVTLPGVPQDAGQAASPDARHLS
ncbi:sensor histidine kinase [Corallococcus sp. H22C18031201]|uniref:HAMP domain-containing sensor histidine kinase n=1 Tax=Citreicoccus inhibens TaxID=2849499 RepID=UPI000E719130|nr:HAMP domain-containing sensor histidine kinase [Citreicoccus inhibens]MBU8900003.1 HAMP domain-containing histidine kinase [Citreicoccus inhibens]RJS20033.1 sensor histidine kinase [Corallococcus sp. H22C18031201]